jgi:hypothetical protein
MMSNPRINNRSKGACHMKMFMLKFFCIVALMFISVLAGMQLANDGIHKMKGYDDPNFQNAVALNDKGEHVKATFLGNEISSHDIDEKKKRLEEISAFNIFSSMGKKVSEGVSNASEQLIHLLTK